MGPALESPPPLRTRVSELLRVDYPIVQAPMGFIAREEMAVMHDLTEKPWGVNIAQMMVADPDIVGFVVHQGVTLVITSAGDPTRYTQQLHDAGITVFYVVPSLRAAQKVVDAGVDGLVVEGEREAASRALGRSRRSSCCRRCVPSSTCRSSQREGS